MRREKLIIWNYTNELSKKRDFKIYLERILKISRNYYFNFTHVGRKYVKLKIGEFTRLFLNLYHAIWSTLSRSRHQDCRYNLTWYISCNPWRSRDIVCFFGSFTCPSSTFEIFRKWWCGSELTWASKLIKFEVRQPTIQWKCVHKLL